MKSFANKTRAVLKRATNLLTPVVVSFGAEVPRFSSFCDSIVNEGNESFLVLQPIAADSLPRFVERSGVMVHARDANECWSIRASSIEKISSCSARIALSEIEFSSTSRRSRLRTNVLREPLTLAVPGNLEDMDVHVFPILDVGSTHCTVETSTPLEPGVAFPAVEILSARRVLRRSAATVVDAIPWFTADGAKLFRCRLVFRAPEREEQQSRLYDLISEPVKVVRILQLACLLNIRGWYDAHDGHRRRLSFHALEGPSLTLHTEENVPLDAANQIFRVGFELFTVGYEMEVRRLHTAGSVQEVALPLLLRRRQWRREHRVAVSQPGQVMLRYTSPGTFSRETRRVLDLSFGGLCFEVDRARDALWAGLPLENVELLRDTDRIRIGEIEVRAIESTDQRTVCHVMMRSPSIAENNRYIDLLASLRHPELNAEDGSHFDSIMKLHRSVGLFRPHMERNFLPAEAEAAETWRRMHSGVPDLSRSLVQIENKQVVAVVTAIRAYEHSWTAQHMSANPARKNKTVGALDVAYTEHMVPRTDAHYTAMWVTVGNERQTEFLGQFIEVNGTEEAGHRQRVHLWVRKPNAAVAIEQLDTRVRVRRMVASDEQLVGNAAERSYGSIACGALSFVPGEFWLKDTTKRFAKAGVLRARNCYMVERGGEPIAALIEERANSGINFTCVLNAAWIIPIRLEQDPGGRSLSTAIATLKRQATPAGEFYVLSQGSLPETTMTRAGYTIEVAYDFYAYNRAGLQRWYDYVHETQGRMFVRRMLRSQAERLAS